VCKTRALPPRGKHLESAPLYGKLLSLPANIMLHLDKLISLERFVTSKPEQKFLLTNTVAHYSEFLMKRKKFYEISLA